MLWVVFVADNGYGDGSRPFPPGETLGTDDWEDTMEQGALAYRTDMPVAVPSPPAFHTYTNAPVAPHSPPHAGSHVGRGRYFLWGMGGTILSAIGFIGMLAFEQYNGLVAELRADLKHFNEIQGELVKKENFRKHMDRFRDYSQEVQAVKAARDQMEKEWRASEKAREEMARDFQKMRERLAALEGRQAATVVVPAAPTAGGSHH